MDQSLYNQLYSLIVFTISGIIIGILFDVFRIARKSFKTSDILTYIEDICFWIITGIILIYTIFKFNNGEIRIYIFLGLGLGICIYLLTISRYFIKVSVNIISLIKKILYYPIKLIKSILLYIKTIFFKPISFLVINIRSFLTKFYKKTFKNIKVNKLTDKI